MEAGTFTTQGLHKWGQTYNRTVRGYQSLRLVFVNDVEHECSRKELRCNLWRVYIYLHTYQVFNGLEHSRRSHAETCWTQMKIYANKNVIAYLVQAHLKRTSKHGHRIRIVLTLLADFGRLGFNTAWT